MTIFSSLGNIVSKESSNRAEENSGRFVGHYRKFISAVSKIAKPLNSLLQIPTIIEGKPPGKKWSIQ